MHACRPTETYPAIKPYPNEDALIAYAKSRLQQAAGTCDRLTGRLGWRQGSLHALRLLAALNGGQLPKLLVMGALGRCGNGACDFAVKAGIPA